MNDQRLTKDMIGQPRLWRMAMLIDADALDVILYSTVEDNSLIYRHIPLDRAAQSRLKAVEDAVYDNDLLLCDFDRVDCVLRTPRYAFVPAGGDADTALADAAARELWGRYDAERETIVNSTGTGTTLVMSVDRDLAGFIGRTFNNAPIHHCLTPLCRYFASTSRRGNTSKMHIHVRGNMLDIIAFGDGALKLATSHRVSCADDALYYIMASAGVCGFDVTTDEMLLNVDASMRADLTTALRQYVNYVMPIIFPSAMFKAGKESLNAPFELIVIPICE